MEAKEHIAPSPGLTRDDLYFILLRRKWIIIVFGLLGIAAAAGIFFYDTPTYRSEAKLFVRYIADKKQVTPSTEGNASTQSPDAAGENIINSEIEILTSFDLAQEVATSIGPDKILPKGHRNPSPQAAATMILKQLMVDVPRRSNIIRISFRHPNPEMVQKILSELIDSYLKKHLQVHRSVGIFDDFFSEETDKLRAKIAETEDKLRAIRTNTGVTSLEDTRRSLSLEMARIQTDLHNTESELSAAKASVGELEKLLPANNEGEATQFGAPLEKINDYKHNWVRLETMRRRLQELLVQFTDSSSTVKGLRKEITEAESLKTSMEKEFPKLATLAVAVPAAATNGAPAMDPRLERTRVTVLEAKLKTLTNQLDKIRKEASHLDEVGLEVARLERKKQLEEKDFLYYSTSLNQSRTDENLGVSRMSNINKVQTPSPPLRDLSRIKKMLLAALGGGFLGGLGLAFLLELVVDQTVKRPNEMEAKMGLPLYLTIPQIAGKTRAALNGPGSGKRKWLPVREPKPSDSGPNGVMPEQVDPGLQEELKPFYDALRDRVVMHFEEENITRKPKLIGVTSCARGAGATTLASGLAASLSNTGDGKVLLIDLNLHHGGMHPYFEGTSVAGLLDVLDKKANGSAAGQERLDVVAASGSNGSAVSVRSKQFTDLIPRLKASDYDYIVFDLPPVNQTSATMRLSQFMDQVLLVVEAGKTHRNVVRRSLAYLSNSNPSVAGVLNKAPCVVPDWLNPEI